MPSKHDEKSLQEMCGDFFVDPGNLVFPSPTSEESSNGSQIVRARSDAPDQPKDVVVKIRKAKDVFDLKQLEQVVECGKNKQMIKHSDIVDWLGVGCFDYKGEDYLRWYTVEEYMNFGELHSLVETQMQAPERKVYEDCDALHWMAQVSRALSCLCKSQFGPKFFHGGLTMCSIFLNVNADGKTVAKLQLPSRLEAKFPLLANRCTNRSVFRDHITQLDRVTAVDSFRRLNRDYFSFLHSAPEVLSGESPTEPSIVFSFAVVLYETFRRTTMLAFVSPEASVSQINNYIAAVLGGFRPPVPESWPEELKYMILSCWAVNPKDRPIMEEISNRLRRLCCIGLPRSLSVHSDIDALERSGAQRFRDMAACVEHEYDLDESDDSSNRKPLLDESLGTMQTEAHSSRKGGSRGIFRSSCFGCGEQNFATHT